VTGLSPYLTHGIISLPDVARTVAAKHRLGYADKLVFELGWRAFFQHVWASVAQPDAILADMRAANLWSGPYASSLPADITEGRSAASKPLTPLCASSTPRATCITMRACGWPATACTCAKCIGARGADWLHAHLLDGDLPSNHLSWQWVAATFSSKPYLFNASNVAKFAPESAWKAWGSAKSCIGMSYEQLDALATQQGDVGPEPGVHAGACALAVELAVLAVCAGTYALRVRCRVGGRRCPAGAVPRLLACRWRALERYA
jgi:deoxyribodipyrimidine photo-lyase